MLKSTMEHLMMLFFAADLERPKLLEDQGKSLKNSRFTYAIGKLALWVPQESVLDEKMSVLEVGAYERLALANPKLAPYGVSRA